MSNTAYYCKDCGWVEPDNDIYCPICGGAAFDVEADYDRSDIIYPD